MDFKEFKELVERGFAKNLPNITPSEEQTEKLFALTQRMLEVNKSMNLTAIKQEKPIILRHYIDSLMVSEIIKEGANVIDIGCGAGFPTLPLAIFRPDLKILALDGTAKRIAYVQETAQLLGLVGVTAVAGRAEELAHSSEHRESFDYATARAVAALPTLAELCLGFVKVGGSFIAMKAQKADEELAQSVGAIGKCGGEVIGVNTKQLIDFDGAEESRSLIRIAKKSATPKEFPRHYSKISKKPL